MVLLVQRLQEVWHFQTLLNQKKHTWVAVSAFDKAGILGRSFSKICEEITRISDGELNIRLFHANELVSAFESFDVVQSGTCQMGFGSPYYWAGKSSSISLLSGIPFGMNYREMSSWFYNGDGIKLADEVYNQFNLKFFPLETREIKWEVGLTKKFYPHLISKD